MSAWVKSLSCVVKLWYMLVSVPFRDSSLTKLLKNALGGNSKTIMVSSKYLATFGWYQHDRCSEHDSLRKEQFDVGWLDVGLFWTLGNIFEAASTLKCQLEIPGF